MTFFANARDTRLKGDEHNKVGDYKEALVLDYLYVPVSKGMSIIKWGDYHTKMRLFWITCMGFA